MRHKAATSSFQSRTSFHWANASSAICSSARSYHPYFGSYRFVRFAAGDPWHDLFKLLGVHGLGVANGVPVPMPDALIERLKAKEINGAIPGSTPVRALIFSVGDTAKVNEGAFIGFEGKIERMDENGRIRLLLELFAGLVPVDLTADQVDKVTG
jgi:transcription antitermination factor NusG